jgi:hypothetical protein
MTLPAPKRAAPDGFASAGAWRRWRYAPSPLDAAGLLFSVSFQDIHLSQPANVAASMAAKTIAVPTRRVPVNVGNEKERRFRQAATGPAQEQPWYGR